jgi:hypothetical protein
MRTLDRPTVASRQRPKASSAQGRASERILGTVVLLGAMTAILGGCVVSPGYVAPAPVVVAPAPIVVAPGPFIVYGRGWRRW